MLPDPNRTDDDSCPVGDELWSQIYATSEHGLPALVATVPSELRALLALFCYRRSHLQAMGLVIAATCDEDELVRSGGRVGAALFAKSRERPQPAPPAASDYAGRRKITLATGPLRKIAAITEEPESAAI